MKTSYLNRLILCLLIITLPLKIVHGMGNYNNAGTLSLQDSSLYVRNVFNNTGKVIAQGKNECICGTLTGNGLFEGKIIKIVAKDFQFKGVIQCDGECTIITTQSFDHSMFTLKGTGSISYIIDEHAYNAAFSAPAVINTTITTNNSPNPVFKEFKIINGIYSKRQLIPWLENYFKSDNFISLTVGGIAYFVTELLRYIQENGIDQKETLQQIDTILDKHISYNQKYKGKKWDTLYTGTGVLTTLAGIGSIVLCYKHFGLPERSYDDKPTIDEICYIASMIATAAGILITQDGLYRDNHYEERYEHLIELKKQLTKI